MRVVNIRDERCTLYIGRPRSGEPWNFGNPFRVGRDGPRGSCVPKFEQWLRTGCTFGCPDATDARRTWILDHLHLLRDQTLGCFCKPAACHGDVLARLAQEITR